MKTYKDVEKQVAKELCEPLKNLDLLPEGYRCSVQLRGKKNRKPKTAEFNEKNWSPETDSICISFKPISEEAEAEPQSAAQNATTAPSNNPAKSIPQAVDSLSDLVHALARIESRPGYEFVALKWFRDVALPSEGFSWANADSIRQILRDTIDRRLILVSKVANPKSPQFPVTAIRLNRLMPEVAAILGNKDAGMPDFRPVPIRGENLSVTMLRDRR